MQGLGKLASNQFIDAGTVMRVVYLQMFSSLNIQIVLVGLEIWTKENFINVDADSAGDVLSLFAAWRQKSLTKQPRNDVSHLIM